ncbi:MAG: type II toxin-antitoxin system PemK/MazF family toxin [Candidatus Zixiibacteriota bacterium]
MVENYIPSRGDLIWLSFSPQLGYEQAGRRPALIITGFEYNSLTGLCLACPVTKKIKGYPFEVIVPEPLPIEGVILTDHIKSLDYDTRDAEFICKLPLEAFDETLAKLEALIFID